MASRSSLRASDADRDAVAERLRHAAAEGRLDPEELEERLHVALRARTYGDLRRLLADLPGTGLERRVAGATPAARTAFAVAVRVALTLALVAAALVAAAVIAAWWTVWAVVWLVACGHRACAARRVSRPRRSRFAPSS